MSANAAKQAIFEARQALVDCEQGRAMTCEEVLRSVSDSDRRRLRSRRIRAHLRDCAGCAAFDTANRQRQSDLPVLAPALAPAAAAGLLARLLGAHPNHASAGAAVAAGSAGKSVGASLALKTAVAAAILTIGTVGFARALTPTHPAAPSTPRPAAQLPPTARTRFASRAAPAAGIGHRQAATHTGSRRHAHTSTGVLAPSPAQAANESSPGGAGRGSGGGRGGGQPSQADATATVGAQATPAGHTTSGRGRITPPAVQAQPNTKTALSAGSSTAGNSAPTTAGGSTTPENGSSGGTGAGKASAPVDTVPAPAPGSTGATGASGPSTPAVPVNAPAQGNTSATVPGAPASPINASPVNTPPTAAQAAPAP
jgi:hypothetical protein